MRRGDDDWQAWLAEPTELTARVRTTQLSWPLAACAAEWAWLSGSLESVGPELRDAYEEARRERDGWAIGELGRWLWRAGALASLAEHAAVPYRLEVAGQAQAAAEEWDRLGMPFDRALCLAESSEAADVRRAHAELVRLGAMAVARKTALRLRDLGTPVPRGPRPTTRANWGGLTEREAEIARLLAEGLSNGEIADRLILSPRTVGHHVSAVLAKLAIRRRAEVAGALAGLAGAGAPS